MRKGHRTGSYFLPKMFELKSGRPTERLLDLFNINRVDVCVGGVAVHAIVNILKFVLVEDRMVGQELGHLRQV